MTSVCGCFQKQRVLTMQCWEKINPFFFWKLCHHRPILGIYSLTRGLHDTRRWVFRDLTDTHTDRRTWRLYDWHGPEGRVSENYSFMSRLSDYPRQIDWHLVPQSLICSGKQTNWQIYHMDTSSLQSQLFWARINHNKAISRCKFSKVRPQLSFEGTTKTKTVLKPAYQKV